MVAEQADDLLGLVGAHQAVVDEHAGQLVADRLVDQHRRDRAVDPARQAADHPARRRPGRGSRRSWSSRNSAIVQSPAQAADVADEIGEQLAAVGRVDDLGVEHQSNRSAAPRRWRSRRARLRTGRRSLKPSGSCSTRSPWLIHTWWRLAELPQAVEQRAFADDLDEGAAELAIVATARPGRRAGAPSSAGRSRWRGSAGRRRRNAAARAGCRPTSPRTGRRTG